MKKILLILLSFLSLLPLSRIQAQSFTVAADTVYAFVGSTSPVFDDVTNTTSTPLKLNWHISYSNFPADWLTSAAFGVCDNFQCRQNTGDTLLWNGTTHTTGSTFLSTAYTPGVAGGFDYSPNLTTASPGTYMFTAMITDPGTLYSKTETFVITKVPAGVANVINVNEISLYPNPANDEVNIVYDESADIKNVAVYNIIGKVVAVYKVAGNSANLNIANIPSGIYFLRLANSQGSIVATKKFVKQ